MSKSTDFPLQEGNYMADRRFQLVSMGFMGVVVFLSGCATKVSSPIVRFDRAVQYGDSKSVELVTNQFGSTDLQMMSEKMVGSLLETGVFQDRPAVTISTVKNRTSEYIDVNNLMGSIQTQLIKSGKVRFTRSLQEMQSGVDELQRQNQSGLYKEGTTAKIGGMTAAKYTLEGELTSIVKVNGRTKDVFYKLTLKLVDIAEGTIEWAEEKEIRKTSKN